MYLISLYYLLICLGSIIIIELHPRHNSTCAFWTATRCVAVTHLECKESYGFDSNQKLSSQIRSILININWLINYWFWLMIRYDGKSVLGNRWSKIVRERFLIAIVENIIIGIYNILFVSLLLDLSKAIQYNIMIL